MRIAICDDLSSEREALKNMLVQEIKNCTVTEFDNGLRLITCHNDEPFDLIFLDIIMPGISGIETAQEIRKTDKKTPVIFVSTSEEFGVMSYRVLAFDYILKPIDKDVLSESLRRFTDMDSGQQCIEVNCSGITAKILLSNIVCMESNLHKVVLSLSQGRSVTVSAKLSDYEKVLSQHGFIRCHKSYLINAQYIANIVGD